MSKKLCISYCERFGECSIDWDEDDEFDDLVPSSNNEGYCDDDGEDNGCDQFYSKNE